MHNLSLAPRMQELGIGASMRTAGRVIELRRQGKPVIDFMSRPDAPARTKEAALAMLRSPANAAYTDTRGLPSLRLAIADKLRRENSLDADPERNIVVTAGAMGGLSAALLALVGPGDDVLIDDPCFLGFEPKIRIADGNIVRVPLAKEDGFRFDIEMLRDRVTPRTKLLILCTPDNPTGMVRTRVELQAIAEIAEEYDFHVLVDEAYEQFVYDGREHVSMASLDGLGRRIITIQSVSKTYHMHGWRVGWVVAHEAVAEAILAAHCQLVTCPASFAQAGVIAALEDGLGEGDVPIPDMISGYQRKRDVMVSGLNAIAGVQCAKPQGAYFAFPDFSHYRMSSETMASHLLETAMVASTPGSAFGPGGEGHLRLNCNSPVEEIEEGLSRIAHTLSGLAS